MWGESVAVRKYWGYLIFLSFRQLLYLMDRYCIHVRLEAPSRISVSGQIK